MGIAAMRDRLLVDYDIEWWILHFFCMWGVIAASVTYSSRFNDTDVYHRVMWACFLVGIAGQIAFLDHDAAFFAGCTFFLYLLIVASFLRVAYYLPRARPFSLFYALCIGLQASIFLVLAVWPRARRIERGLFWVNAVFEAATHWLFVGITATSAASKSWDVPVTIRYIIGRYQGFHITIIVCSFLFPISLQRELFETSRWSAIAVLLGNLYAVALKLALFDTAVNDPEHNLERHAIRRSRFTAVFYFVLHPIGMLGIGLSGVGFMAAITQKSESFVRTLLCAGSALTWATIGLSKSLRLPKEASVHYWKTAALGVAAALYLSPLAFRLDAHATVIVVVVVMSAQLGAHLLIEKLLSAASDLPNWRFMPPRGLVSWDAHDLAAAPTAPKVTDMEHLISVLVAVGVFQLNEQLLDSALSVDSITQYVLKFGVLWGILTHAFRYAASHGVDDGYHKLLWAAMQFLLLLVLEGQGGIPDEQWSLYKVSLVCVYLLLAICFYGRVAKSLPRARHCALFFACKEAVDAALLLSACAVRGASETLLTLVVAGTLLSEPVLELVQRCAAPTSKKRQDVLFPVQSIYFKSAFNHFLIEIIGVAIVVPNCLYPGAYTYQLHVVFGVISACLLTICLKQLFLDADLGCAQIEQHALLRSPLHAVLFHVLQPMPQLGIALSGVAITLLIKGAGEGGEAAQHTRAQTLLCAASAAVMASLAFIDALHKPRPHCALAHSAKVIAGLVAAASTLAVYLQGDTTDLFVLLAFVAIYAALVFVQARSPNIL